MTKTTKDRETASPASEDVVERLAKLLNSHFGVGNSEHWPVYTQNARDILAAFPLASPTPRMEPTRETDRRDALDDADDDDLQAWLETR
jgi:hypothetical protein